VSKGHDAQFRFAMSEDGMKLGVSRYFPPQGGEGPSVALLKRQVAEAGVTLPVDEDAARQIIDAIQRDEEIRRIVLVRGISVQEPCNATLMALGNLEYPVFPGDRFARKHPPVSARVGETIDRRTIPPKDAFEPQDITVTLGDNVEFDPLTHAYVSTVWGMARLRDGIISVDPVAHIDDDAITVTATIHHQDFRGQDMTVAKIEKELRDLGTVIEIDQDGLDTLIRRARKQNLPLPDQVVVAGRYPVPGHDGWLEYLVSTREHTGTEDESGRLNFRDRGAYPMVNPGQTVARLHPPTQGQGGIDIYGKTIPANAGKELVVHPGENIVVQEDKITFIAKAKGIMSMDHGVLSVTECLLISGNVDMSTGNITVEHGSIKILGSIQAGFSVSAPQNVVVGGSVESATVRAGGGVEVSGGILMPDGGSVRAEGNVSAAYATNARIHAGGDVIIANDITNCEISAGGRLIGTRGKGHIQGGTIVTARGIEVNELGSELGVQTSVAVRIEHEEDESLRHERKKIKQAIRKIDDALGTDPIEVILTRTKPDKRAAVAEVLKHRLTLIKRRKTITEQLNQLNLARQEELAGVKIKVNRLLHPGAVLHFGSKTFPITSRTEASVISWDERARDIVFA
jgi:uncharacterized protein (DUF342 family)